MLSTALRQAMAEPESGLDWFQAWREEELKPLTHAVLHHHEPTFVAFEALTLKAAWRVDTDPTSTEIRGDPALVDV